MIILDAGTHWQLVCQPDHGDLAGQLVVTWGNDRFESVRSKDSVELAATRHDDGWAVWERWPRLLADTYPRPFQFYEVPVPIHVAFYRAAITDISAHDPYAGLLVAMHGAGIYRGRYGTEPELKIRSADKYSDDIESFVAEAEMSYDTRSAEVGVDDSERWTNYKLLQVFDRLSLYFSGLHALEEYQVHQIGRVPLNYVGDETDLQIRPLSPFQPFAPWHVEIDPYPFADEPLTLTLVRRVLEKKRWTSAEFRNAFDATIPETVELRVDPPSDRHSASEDAR